MPSAFRTAVHEHRRWLGRKRDFMGEDTARAFGVDAAPAVGGVGIPFETKINDDDDDCEDNCFGGDRNETEQNREDGVDAGCCGAGGDPSMEAASNAEDDDNSSNAAMELKYRLEGGMMLCASCCRIYHRYPPHLIHSEGLANEILDLAKKKAVRYFFICNFSYCFIFFQC